MPAAENTATKQVLDFTNVKESSGINPKHRPAGDYPMKISKVIQNESSKGNPQWVFSLTPTDMQSATYPYYCTLNAESLWKVRNLLIAAGIDVPKKRVGVDPNKLIGRLVGVTLDDDEYDGKIKSVITAVFPASDLDDSELPADADDSSDDVEDEEDDVEETPAPVARKAAAKPKAKPAPAPEPEADDVSDEDLDELDVEDL